MHGSDLTRFFISIMKSVPKSVIIAIINKTSVEDNVVVSENTVHREGFS